MVLEKKTYMTNQEQSILVQAEKCPHTKSKQKQTPVDIFTKKAMIEWTSKSKSLPSLPGFFSGSKWRCHELHYDGVRFPFQS